MVRRIAIIPARGGSKRIPDKNIRHFLGKPMISYILNTAEKSGLFDKIHVSTDSKKVIDVVKNFGFEIDFIRPDSLSDDHTSLMPVIKYVVKKYLSLGQHFDEIWLLMACAPLICPDDILKASELFDKYNGKASLLSITEYPAPIEWAFTKKISGELCPIQPGMFSKRSQDIEKKYYDAGAFVVFPVSEILSDNELGNDDNFVGYIIPKARAIDIDDENDWMIAEALASNFLT
jgi:N-acylneuraminate cytidylyltransferase